MSGRNGDGSRVHRLQVKVPKTENTTADLRVWCEGCCIRVAPNEERIVVRGETYHSRCYSKLNTKHKVHEGLPS